MKLTRHMALAPLTPLLMDWKEWDRELIHVLNDVSDYVTKVVSTRGIDLIMIDFPAIGKSIDRGLSTGYFDWTSHKVLTTKKRNPIRILLGYYFSDAGFTIVEDPNDIFFLRTLFYMWKKYDIDCTPDKYQAMYDQFVATDATLPSPTRDWSQANIPDWNSEEILARMREMTTSSPSPLIELLIRVSSEIGRQMGNVSQDLWPRHGRGAVAEGTKFRDKFDFKSWPAKLDQEFPASSYAVHDMSFLDLDSIEPPARIIGVPKTYKGPRIITAEPLSNQYCQQAVLSEIRAKLPRSIKNCYCSYSQEPSRQLCRKGSVDGDYVTIDLSEASDRLSTFVVECLIRNESFLRLLYATRTQYYVLPGQTTPSVLNKYAGMGNATTFPVQSIVYSIFCITAHIFVRGKSPRSGKALKRAILSASKHIQVFGDDIIVGDDVSATLMTLLCDFGFKINQDKSHTEGYFREACGLDAYRGHDVTPFYFRNMDVNTPESLVSWVEVSNNAYKKGLWNISDWMRKRLDRRPIPVSSSDSFGISFHSFQDVFAANVKSREVEVKDPRQPNYQRKQYRVLTLCTSQKRVERDDNKNLLQYFVERPSATTDWSAGWVKSSGAQLRVKWS